MTFVPGKLAQTEIQSLAPRVLGPILSFSRACAIDQQNNAMFVSLGGQPWRDPADGEPPGHFNLFWQDSVIGASGHHATTSQGNSATIVFTVTLQVPRALERQIDEVTRLVKEGLAVYWRSLTPFERTVDVNISEVIYF